MVLVVPGQLIDFDRRQQQSAVFRDRRRSVEVEDLQARVASSLPDVDIFILPIFVISGVGISSQVLVDEMPPVVSLIV